MAYLEWNDNYALGIAELDMQHRRLLAMISDFYRALETQALGEAVDDLLARLKAYAMEHFATEEGYLLRYGYPKLDEQQRQHQDFVAKLGDLMQRRDARVLGGSIEVTRFLKTWWNDHILRSDMGYREWLVSRGAR